MDDAGLIDKEDLGSTHTRAGEVHGEVLTGPERRRRWSLEEKLRILAQSVAPGSSASLVCWLHGISSGQLYTWRRTGELTGFGPVRLAPPAEELDQWRCGIHVLAVFNLGQELGPAPLEEAASQDPTPNEKSQKIQRVEVIESHEGHTARFEDTVYFFDGRFW